MAKRLGASPRLRLLRASVRIARFHLARWQSGYAAACKAVYPGSIPSRASRYTKEATPDGWLLFCAVARCGLVMARGAGFCARGVCVRAMNRSTSPPCRRQTGFRLVQTKRCFVSHAVALPPSPPSAVPPPSQREAKFRPPPRGGCHEVTGGVWARCCNRRPPRPCRFGHGATVGFLCARRLRGRAVS